MPHTCPCDRLKDIVPLLVYRVLRVDLGWLTLPCSFSPLKVTTNQMLLCYRYAYSQWWWMSKADIPFFHRDCAVYCCPWSSLSMTCQQTCSWTQKWVYYRMLLHIAFYINVLLTQFCVCWGWESPSCQKSYNVANSPITFWMLCMQYVNWNWKWIMPHVL